MRLLRWLVASLLFFGCARANPPRGRDDAFTGDDVGAHDAGASDAFVGHDALVPGNDAFMPGNDAFTPGNDAFVNDAFTPPNDAHVPGAYLDRCTAPGDCASGLCALDRGGTHFCTRSCTSDIDCAHGQLCATTSGGRACMPSDTGAPCSVATPAQCNAGLCLGSAAGGHCTRTCSSAAECPAGYACSHVAGSTTLVCIDIEQPCAGSADCGGGYCTTFGCTAPCRSPSDCPARFPASGGSAAFPAYACNTSLGSADPICIPPSDIMGSSPIGASCPATGTNSCRSDACDTSAPLGPMCTQACTAQGGCAVGLGCTPIPNGSDIVLVCERAGTRDLLQSCAHGSDCVSGLCDAMGFCTRLCADGICPTGSSCQPIPGFGIALCRR